MAGLDGWIEWAGRTVSAVGWMRGGGGERAGVVGEEERFARSAVCSLSFGERVMVTRCHKEGDGSRRRDVMAVERYSGGIAIDYVEVWPG